MRPESCLRDLTAVTSGDIAQGRKELRNVDFVKIWADCWNKEIQAGRPSKVLIGATFTCCGGLIQNRSDGSHFSINLERIPFVDFVKLTGTYFVAADGSLSLSSTKRRHQAALTTARCLSLCVSRRRRQVGLAGGPVFIGLKHYHTASKHVHG
jgi:hypothetical protein